MATVNYHEPEHEKEETLEKKYIALLERQVRILERLPAGDPAKLPLRRLSISTHAGADLDSFDHEVDDDAPGPANDEKIQYRMKRYNDQGFQVEEAYDPKRLEVAKPAAANSAATFMLYFDPKKNHIETEIKIESAAVRSILQQHLKHYPGYHWGSPRLSIFAPFKPLIHNWDVLTKAAEESLENEGGRHLKEVLDAVKVSKEVKEYFETRDAMGDSVVFDFLWMIFPPGELIILLNSFMKQKQVFIVRETTELLSDRADRKKYMAITCWAYDWDGSRREFNRVAVELKIDFYKGQRLITSLPCYPLKYYTGNLDKLKESLIKRGRRFQDLCMRPSGNQMFEYEGLVYFRGTGVRHIQGNRSGGPTDDASIMHHLARLGRFGRSVMPELRSKSGRQLNMKGRIMIDFESYVRHGPNEPIPMGELSRADEDEDDECRCDLCMADGGPKDNQKYEWDANHGKNDFHNDQYIICPPRVLGYHLMEKKWVELLVDCVQDIETLQVTNAFDKLQLTPKKKKLIQELVQSHTNDKIRGKDNPRSQMNDLTKGPPGVGKTLTAESVAQATGKPLFPIGVGDVTTDPSLVEKRLEQLFELAEVWQAVMLFDEADVFLESRASVTDVTRVGLVSVLLRVLEYYQGILILTTNRIRSFDIAVQSRINLAIQFQDLNERQKRSIFQNLVEQLDDDFVENKNKMITWMKDDEEAATSFSGLNGRQVRNIIFSAASLAGNRPTEENVLKIDDIKRMLEETVNFQRHLQELTKQAREKSE